MNWTVAVIFLGAMGACVGSFINVVIFRVPEEKSLLWPPSHCPSCSNQLKWWENVPVFSWFYLGGKCRTCNAKIHIQYPIVEAIGAVLFVGLFVVFYQPQLAAQLGHPYATGFEKTWPIYLVHVFLLASLLAACWIDAKLYIIPLEIPWLSTAVALLGLGAYAWWMPLDVPAAHITLPSVTYWGVNMAIGGVGGLAISLMLLAIGVLPRSFDDEEMHALEEQSIKAEAQLSGEGDTQQEQSEQPEQPEQDSESSQVQEEQAGDESGVESGDETGGETGGESDDQPQVQAVDANPIELFLTYSQPRREVLKELLFLMPPIVGALLLLWLQPYKQGIPADPIVVKVIAGVVCGYLVGAGMVWITRVLGTLGFGKEAMGLGDVHLLGAIGAALGPKAVCLIFFIAPFLGLTYVLIAVGVSKAMRGQVRVIPYGPYLALATLMVVVAPGPIWNLLVTLIWRS